MQRDLLFSVVIPYKQRLDNIRLALSALAEQTLDRSRFEVVVGALEYAPEFTALCAEFSDRLDIVTVGRDTPWNLCHARNQALRQVSGQVLVVMDADMVVPTRFLENLHRRYFQHGQRICVVGQMIGYDQVYRTDVEHVEFQPFDHYREILAGIEAQDDVRMDFRWSPEYRSAFDRFPWVYACGALVAVPADVVAEHGLTYEEGFQGWGPEDQEWSRRVSRTGTPIVLGEQVFGMHLPHLRSMADQSATEIANWRFYLRKWPELDVEMAIAFDQLEADSRYPGAQAEIDGVTGPDATLAVVRGTQGGRDVLVVGALLGAGGVVPAEVRDVFDDRTPTEVLPLAGLALPYPDRSLDECRVLAPIGGLGAPYRDIVVREAERVAAKVTEEPRPSRSTSR